MDLSSWSPGWDEFPQPLLDFWTERHLCTLTTLRPDGCPHVVPVGVALDLERQCAWVISSGGSRKVRNLADGGPVAACQVDGRRWSTIEGRATVLDDAESVARACDPWRSSSERSERIETRYAARYRTPRNNPERVAIRIEIDRFLGSSPVGFEARR